MADRFRHIHDTLRRALRDVAVSAMWRAPDVFSYTTPAELRTLQALASSLRRSATIVEVGSYLGASSICLARGIHHRGGVLYCIDTWTNDTMPEGSRDTFLEFTRNTARFRGAIRPIRVDTRHLDPSSLPECIDLVFIDGDHSYDAVGRDFRLLQDRVRPAGVVAFHDFRNPDYPGVSRVVGEALASGEWTIAGMVEYLVWIRRVRLA